MKTYISFHEKFKKYDLGSNHPFRGDRFTIARKFFEFKQLPNLPNVHFFEPEKARLEVLSLIHSEKYIDHIFKLADLNKPYDVDTPVSNQILNGLMYILGGVCESGESIYNGSAEQAVGLGGGFHHSGKDYGGGFCLFNDIAILVESIRQKHNVGRILILDYDVHFGNGTSDIFYTDPNTLFISFHQDPRTIYPGIGFINDIGEKEGKGFNINVPLPPRTGEKSYLYIFNEIFPQVASEFKPEIIIGNGGSDAHFADHLGSLGLTSRGFFEIGRVIRKTAKTLCGGKSILLIGSGYNMKVLPYCWYAIIMGIVGNHPSSILIDDYYPSPKNPRDNKKQIDEILKNIKRILGDYWSNL